MELARRLFERVLDLLPGYRTHERLVDSYYRAMRTTGHEMRVDPVKNRDRNTVFAMANDEFVTPELRKAIGESMRRIMSQGPVAGGMGDGVAVEANTHSKNPAAGTSIPPATRSPDATKPDTRTLDAITRSQDAIIRSPEPISGRDPSIPVLIDTHSPDTRWRHNLHLDTRDSCVNCRGEGCWACLVMPDTYTSTRLTKQHCDEPEPLGGKLYVYSINNELGIHMVDPTHRSREPLADHDVLARLAEFEAMMDTAG